MDLLSPAVLAGTALAVLIGVSLGLLGGGGSILTVPILVYVVGVDTHEAIALSLLIVGTTSVAALVPHARAGRVRWRTGAMFGATSMLGAFAAGKLARFVPGAVLLLLFGAMMLVTALAMMRNRRPEANVGGPVVAEARPRALTIAKIVLEGLSVGAVTGLVGAGGGFLVVPALLIFAKLPMRSAVGTSLLVIAMKSFAAFAGYATSTHVHWDFAAMATAAAVAGSLVGGSLVTRISPTLLRRGFAWFVIVMAVFILTQELPGALGYRLSSSRSWPLVLGASAVPLALAAVDLVRRARSPRRKPSHLRTSIAH
jgi:uncharacterized membrane protein YfcA